MGTWIFAGLGVFSGVLHAAALRRAAEQAGAGFGFWWRLMTVGGILVFAALSKHILSAALGWVAAFAIATLVFSRSLK